MKHSANMFTRRTEMLEKEPRINKHVLIEDWSFDYGKWSNRRIANINSTIYPTFKSKEEYLEFKLDWKSDYKDVSNLIRKEKFEDPDNPRNYFKLNYLRELASMYLIILKKSKIEAAKQSKTHSKLKIAS